jgi:hypothetical protein
LALKHTRLECIQERKLKLVPPCSQLWIASYLSPSLRHVLNEKLNGALHQNVSSWLQLIQVQAEGTKVNPDFDFLLHDIRIQALIDSKFNMVHHLGATWTKQLFARYMQLFGSWLMHLILQDLIRDPSAPKVEVGWP